jgi:salicylate hydroxylase
MRTRAVVLADGLTGREVVRMDLQALRPGKRFPAVPPRRSDRHPGRPAAALGVEIETGVEVTGIEIAEDHARLEIAGQDAREVPFLSAPTGCIRACAACSTARANPFFTGQVAWRALVPAGAASGSRRRSGWGRGGTW